jgi:hypothetical protein
MKKVTAAGVGALAFVVLSLAGMFMANGPGGNYKASDVTAYLKHSHRPAIWVATYLVILGVVGLALLLAHLRDSMPSGTRRTLFRTLTTAGISAWIAGWGIAVSVPVAMAYGGKAVVVPPTVTYVLNECGYTVLTGGAIVIGLALLTFVIGTVSVPAWYRWFTLVGVLGAVTSPLFFPFALFFIWAAVTGIWLLVAQPIAAREAAIAT